jgi:hypothetical protein
VLSGLGNRDGKLLILVTRASALVAWGLASRVWTILAAPTRRQRATG